MGGLIFAYFGEGKPPPLPRYPHFEIEGILDTLPLLPTGSELIVNDWGVAAIVRREPDPAKRPVYWAGIDWRAFSHTNLRFGTSFSVSFSSSPSVTNRAAIATAFLTALADDRPWPTMQAPLTPRSGAPPYSELCLNGFFPQYVSDWTSVPENSGMKNESASSACNDQLAEYSKPRPAPARLRLITLLQVVALPAPAR